MMRSLRNSRFAFLLALSVTACQPVNINVGEVRGIDARGATVGDVNASADINANTSVNANANVNASANVNTGTQGAGAGSQPPTPPAPSTSGENAPRDRGQQSRLAIVAGTGKAGLKNDHALSAEFNAPGALTFDLAGNLLVADTANRCIRQVTPDGTVTTALEGKPAGTKPEFKTVKNDDGIIIREEIPAMLTVLGLAVDKEGAWFIGDPESRRVWRRSPAGELNVFAEGLVQIHYASGGETEPIIAAQVVATVNYNTYTISPEGRLMVFGHSGSHLAATTTRVGGIVANDDGTAYATDPQEHRIIKFLDGSSRYEPFVGGSFIGKSGFQDDVGAAARFNRPTLLTRDHKGNLYVFDSGNAAIRKVTPAGQVTTLYKADASGTADATQLTIGEPGGMVVDKSGILYLSDKKNHRILRLE